MSRDVIKRGDFEELFASAAREGRPVTAVPRYSSQRVRFQELVDRLAEAEERERRHVEEAAREAREQALEEAAREHDEVLQAFRSATRELQERARAITEMGTEDLVELSTAIAEKVVRREIRSDDDYVLRLVRRCLRKILGPSVVRIRLHPDDRDRVADAAPTLTAETAGPHQLTFEGDRRVERGGCVVETPDFVVDARRSTQLTAARAALKENS